MPVESYEMPNAPFKVGNSIVMPFTRTRDNVGSEGAYTYRFELASQELSVDLEELPGFGFKGNRRFIRRDAITMFDSTTSSIYTFGGTVDDDAHSCGSTWADLDGYRLMHVLNAGTEPWELLEAKLSDKLEHAIINCGCAHNGVLYIFAADRCKMLKGDGEYDRGIDEYDEDYVESTGQYKFSQLERPLALDLATGNWSELAESSAPMQSREGFGTIRGHGTKIYLVGGTTRYPSYGHASKLLVKAVSRSIEVFDTVTKKWSVFPARLAVGRIMPYVAFHKGKLIVAGGTVPYDEYRLASEIEVIQIAPDGLWSEAKCDESHDYIYILYMCTAGTRRHLQIYIN